MKSVRWLVLMTIGLLMHAQSQEFFHEVEIAPTIYKTLQRVDLSESPPVTIYQALTGNESNIGHRYIYNDVDDNITSLFKYSLGTDKIPAGAVITVAKLHVMTSTNWSNYRFDVHQSPDEVTPQDCYDQPCLSNRWNQAVSGTIVRSPMYAETVDVDVLGRVTARMASGFVVYGCESREKYQTSFATVTMKLKVTYYLPFSVTLQNNFPQGTMGIVGPGINNPAANVPYTVPGVVLGNQFNLTSNDQPGGDGYQRIWNDYAPNFRSTWMKTTATGVPTTVGYSRSIGFNSSETDAGAFYTANLRKSYSFVRRDQTEPLGIRDVLSSNVVEQNTITSTPSDILNINGRDYFFKYWTDGYPSVQRTDLPVDNTIVMAKYKGHKVTDAPSCAETKNQRRILYGRDHYGAKYWMVVYESMGDIWLTMFFDDGSPYVYEQRLNSAPGNASNPTISNTVADAYNTDCAVIGWLEGTGATRELHVQSIKFEWDYWGWTYSGGNRGESHLVLGFPYITDLPSSAARPALALIRSGGAMTITYAFERSNEGGGLVAGKFQVPGDNLDLVDGDVISHRVISTDPSAQLPAIVSYNATNSNIYYFFGGYSTFRLKQHQYHNNTTSDVQLSSGDDLGFSLQASTNYTSGAWSLVAQVRNSSLMTVNCYTIGMYGLSLKTKYWNMKQPSVMMDNVSAPPFSWPLALTMKSNSSETWYQSNGTSTTTSIGTGIAATWLRERVGSGDRVMQQVLTSTSPASIVRYPSSGGGLSQAAELPAVVETQATRYWTDQKGKVRAVGIKFGRSKVEILSERETGDVICAVRISSLNGTNLATQVDSLRSDIGLELERNDKTIASYSASSWNRIGTANLKDIQAGDVVYFKVPSKSTRTWGYEEVWIDESGEQRAPEVDEQNGRDIDELVHLPTSDELSGSYPSPFNPSTTIRYQIARGGFVKIAVFDMLGREVKLLVNEEKAPGFYNAVFNADQLSSGIYIARMIVQAIDGTNLKSRSMKLQLLK